MLRNGEQLLLAVVIPVIVLFGGVTAGEHLDLDLPSSRPLVDIFTPGVIALAVMSTSFTSLAIATGFERRYGVIKRLGSSPLPRSGLLAGKIGALLLVAAASRSSSSAASASCSAGRPSPACSASRWRSLLGTAAFASLGLFVAGALRAEATLAAANLIYLLLMAGGGVVLPLTAYGDARRLPAVAAVRRARRGDAHRLHRRRRRLARPRRAARLGRARHRPHGKDLQVGVTYGCRTGCATSTTGCVGWAWASIVVNIGIVVTGGVVRLTGSGLGCPTWPRCTDESLHAARRVRRPLGDRVRQPDADLRAGRGRGRHVRRRLAVRSARPAPARAGHRARHPRPGGDRRHHGADRPQPVDRVLPPALLDGDHRRRGALPAGGSTTRPPPYAPGRGASRSPGRPSPPPGRSSTSAPS